MVSDGHPLKRQASKRQFGDELRLVASSARFLRNFTACVGAIAFYVFNNHVTNLGMFVTNKLTYMAGFVVTEYCILDVRSVRVLAVFWVSKSRVFIRKYDTPGTQIRKFACSITVTILFAAQCALWAAVYTTGLGVKSIGAMAVAERTDFLLSSGYAFYVPLLLAVLQCICVASYKISYENRRVSVSQMRKENPHVGADGVYRVQSARGAKLIKMGIARQSSVVFSGIHPHRTASKSPRSLSKMFGSKWKKVKTAFTASRRSHSDSRASAAQTRAYAVNAANDFFFVIRASIVYYILYLFS